MALDRKISILSSTIRPPVLLLFSLDTVLDQSLRFALDQSSSFLFPFRLQLLGAGSPLIDLTAS